MVSIRTGHGALDKLLARLHRRKDEWLEVLERPEIALPADASATDLRSFVTRRRISGGTMSRDGRMARDTLLGLPKTGKKPRLSSWHHRGDRLGIGDQAEIIPPLAGLVAART